MSKYIPKKEGSAQLFRSKYLDILTRTSPLIIIPLDLFLIFILLYYGKVYRNIELWSSFHVFVLGLFSWTFIEYFMHRFAFHFESERKQIQKAVYAVHLIHHHYPKDKDRLFQPPLVNILLALVFFLLFFLIMGDWAFVYTPGIILGYVLYSSIHYSIHKFKPPFAWLKPIWRHHHLHHYRYDNKAFGVSSPFWDYIFGTLPPAELVEEEERSTH